MEVNELLNLGKSKVRSNKELSNLFKGFFIDVFGSEPKICCSFSDFNLLRSYYSKPSEKMMLTKYKVLFSRDKILSYLKSGKVYRIRASHATDSFLDEFVKHANKRVYPNVDKMVELIESKPRVKKPVMTFTEDVKSVNTARAKEVAEIVAYEPKKRKPKAKKVSKKKTNE